MTEFKQCSIILNGEENFNITIDNVAYDTKFIINLIREQYKFQKKEPKYVQIEHCGGINQTHVTVSVDDMIEALRRINIICVKKS